MLGPAELFSAAEVAEMLGEATGQRPRWGNIFNESPPYLTRPSDGDSRQAAYGLDEKGKLPPGGPYAKQEVPCTNSASPKFFFSRGEELPLPDATTATSLPALWGAGCKLLAAIQQAFPDTPLAINDAAYVQASGDPQVLHQDLQP